MKRVLLSLLIIFIILATFTVTASENSRVFNGKIYGKDNNMELKAEKIVKNVKITKTKDFIEGKLVAENRKMHFSAKLTKSQDGINSYHGTIIDGKTTYNCDIVENENGMSILYYDDSREFVKTIILSSKGNDTETIREKINKEVIPSIKENKIQHSVDIVQETTLITQSMNPITNVHHIFKDAISIPLVIGGGTVEGWFTYQTNVEPSVRFYAMKMEGYINWESGFDSISITNENEMYGVFWGTPSCPSKNYQTWNIGMMAEKQGAYYINATVSYYLLVDALPVLFWDSDSEYIYCDR